MAHSRPQRQNNHHRSDDRYGSLIQISPNAVFVFLNDRIILFNSAALILFGTTDGNELTGKTIAELFCEGNLSFSETITHSEQKIIRKDGSFREVEVNSSCFTDRKGTTIQMILRDITAEKRAIALNRALKSIEGTIHSTLHFDEIMRNAVSKAAEVIGCETASASLRRENKWKIGYVYNFPDGVIGYEMDDNQEIHAFLAINTGKPVVINNAFEDPRVNTEHMRKWQVQSVLVVPLMVRNEGIGVVFFNYHTRTIEFDQLTIDFATSLASDLSLALENSLLYKNTQEELTQRIKTHLELEELKILAEARANEAEKLNKTLRALGRSSQAMAHCKEESAYLKEVCGIVVEECGYSMVWIGYAEQNEKKMIKPVASAGFDDGYIDSINVTWDETERGNGPSGIAVRTGKPCIIRNMDTDPRFLPWRDEAVRRKYKSSVALPLMEEGIAFGVICIYSREENGFSEDEVKLFLELSKDLAYGITAIHIREIQIRTELALRESEEKYRMLFDRMIDGFCLNELLLNEDNQPVDYRFLSVNHAYEQFTGKRASDIIGKTALEINPHLENYWIEIFADVALTGNSVEFENYSPELKKHYKASVFSHKKGYFAVIYEDITQRKRTSIALSQSEEKFRRLTENSNAFICEIDEAGDFLYVNSKYKENLGYDPEDLVGKPASNICHPDMKEAFNRVIERAVTTYEPSRNEWLLKNKAGISMWFDCYSNTTFNSSGELSISLVSFDITEKKNTEEQLKKLVTDLKNLNATKDKFFRIIAHDLKNPFSILLGASEVLMNSADQYDVNSVREFSKILNKAAKSGYALLENLLEWAKSQTGGMAFNPQKVNIAEIVSENIMAMQLYISNKNLRLHSEITGDFHAIADRDMLNTVLRNLLNNAIKFTHEGGEVSVCAQKDNQHAVLLVKDSGIGIEKEDMDKLFRIDMKYTHKGTAQESGTGLGLILCKDLVERQGGKIWVESIPGKGSEFYFTLPLPKDDSRKPIMNLQTVNGKNSN